ACDGGLSHRRLRVKFTGLHLSACYHWAAPIHNPETTVRTLIPCAGSRHVATHDAGSGAGTGSSLRLAFRPHAMAPFSPSQFPKREGSSCKLDPDLTPRMGTAARARQSLGCLLAASCSASVVLAWITVRQIPATEVRRSQNVANLDTRLSSESRA